MANIIAINERKNSQILPLFAANWSVRQRQNAAYTGWPKSLLLMCIPECALPLVCQPADSAALLHSPPHFIHHSFILTRLGGNPAMISTPGSEGIRQ